MKKTFALLLIAIILVIILINLISTPSEKNSTASDVDTTQENTKEVIEPSGENLVSEFYETIIRDDTGEESFGNLGDTSISDQTAIQEYGLSINIEVFDTNDNSAIDINETTPVRLTIHNSSENKYIIKNVRIDGLGDMFDDDSFSNIDSSLDDNIAFSFDRNRLVYNKDEFEINPNEDITFSFDANWSKAFIYGLAADEYIQFNFSAVPVQDEEEDSYPAIYFELGVQAYNFSNETF